MNKQYRDVSLEGRTALITGAGGGTGRQIAVALGKAGVNVVVTARREATAIETAALLKAEGASVLPVSADVTRRRDMEQAVEAAVDEFGGLHIVIHNAVHPGSSLPQDLLDIDELDWDAQTSVSLRGAFLCAQTAYPHLRNAGAKGRFLLLGSAFGQHGAGHNPNYAATKAAFRGFTRSLAREWGEHGTTVNMIAPSSLTEAAESYLSVNPELRDEYLAGFALGRMGRPEEDIGGAVVSICSEAFGYITGQTIMVDGGLYTVM